MGSLSSGATCYDAGVVTGHLERTVEQERVLKKCAAVASPSGSLEIYFMVIKLLFTCFAFQIELL